MLLEVENIHVYYGAIHAIKGVSFEVNEGEIVTLIGANGAPDPTATTLGEFCADKRTALAVKEVDGGKSIYCAGMVMRSDLLASIAAGVGCHIYTTRDDVLYANEDYVTLHATGDGVRTVRFKRRCSPYEVYEKRHFARDVTELAVEMKDGQTYTWFVGKP